MKILSSIARIALPVILLVGAHATSRAQTLSLPNGDVDLGRLQLDALSRPMPNDHGAQLDRLRSRPDLTAPGLVPQFVPIPEEPTQLERYYSERIGSEIKHFGYDFLRSDVRVPNQIVGAVPNEYMLGFGDELVITLRGQANESYTARIDGEGNVTLPNLAPIPAAGRSFGEFRQDLQGRVEESYIRTDSFVSLGAVRSVGVVVAGEVERPGRKMLNSFATVVDALFAAGGIRKTGSLRSVTLLRDGERQQIDLYELLIEARSPSDLRLRDGDQIVIGPIGPTIAIVGSVIRPAIYELPAGSPRIDLGSALAYAGGSVREIGNEVTVRRIDQSGRDQYLEPKGRDFRVAANDILRIALPMGGVALEGAVRDPGARSVLAAQTLRKLLIDSRQLADDPYLPFAIIVSRDPVTRVQHKVPIDLDAVITRGADVGLQPSDTVLVFRRSDIQYLSSDDVQAVLAGRQPPSLVIAAGETRRRQRLEERLAGVGVSAEQAEGASALGLPEEGAEPGTIDTPGGLAQDDRPGLVAAGQGGFVQTTYQCRGLSALSEAITKGGGSRFFAATLLDVDAGSPNVLNVQQCPEVFERFPDVLPFLLEYSASVQGEVRQPGVYPVVAGSSVSAVLRAAGGTTAIGDASSIRIMGTDGSIRELSAMDVAASLMPGESLRVSPQFLQRERGFVTLSGEVTLPGRYEFRRGEKLSDLIRRAGGLTDQAYAYGAVFTREAVRVAQAEANQRTAREIEAAIPSALASGGAEAQALAQALPFIQGLVAQIRSTKPVGRVVIEADPVVLMARPELDFTVQAGDRLVIPKRPTHVSVAGEVLNPGAVMFRSGMTARDYIERAGGFGNAAERGRSFIIYPDGAAQDLELGGWGSSDIPVPPGSTIVVPRDPAPFSWSVLTRDILAIVRDLSISAASLAVLASN